MDGIYQILTWIFGGTSFLGVFASFAYYKQNRRLKEAEVKEKEVDVEKTKIEARKSEIELLFILLNETKNDIIRLTEERDNERARADYAEMWRCEWSDCQDPRGRKPPRDLSGLEYSPPKRVRNYFSKAG